MNLKAQLKSQLKPMFTIGLLALLSACSAHKGPSQEQSLPSASSPAPYVEPTAGENGETPADPVAEPSLEAVAVNDVLDRIRQGFEFPNLESKHVDQYETWASEHHSYLNNLFARGTPFLFHIVEEIEKRNLPMELALLPAVESAYRPTAVSRSKAGGLWQFIPSTGRAFNLRQDWWYDGRNDPLESTEAALDYLTQLHKRFDGDWFLALAAYNAGQGTVSRAIKANKAKRRPTSYQDLALRLETRRYIPKLIALKNIIENPQKFDVELPEIKNEAYFKVVPLNGQIDLKKFSKDAGIEQAELRNLNAGFRRWATSPDGPHRLLIPVHNNADISQAIAAAERAPKLHYQNHRITQGDSLSSIARRYGVSVSALKSSNNLRTSRIRAGKDLLIPVRANASEARNSQAQVSSSNLQDQVHHVKRGDTLWSIARQYKVQLSKLMSWNNLSKNQVLRLNQQLLVRTN